MKQSKQFLKHVVEPVQDENGDFLWSIYEPASELTIETHFFAEDANRKAKFYSSGGGFAGFTPAFMTTPSYKPKNIDEEFSVIVE